MALFPNIAPSLNYKITPKFRTIITGDTDDPKQRKRKRLTPLFDIELLYSALTIDQANITTLYDFFIARSGQYESFTFVDFAERTWNLLSIGTGTGAQVAWNLQAKETSSRAITVNAVAQVEGTDYTFSALGGTDGQDKITFAVAPTLGHAIVASYKGKRFFNNCIFQDDNISLESFSKKLVATGLNISQFS